MPNVDKHGSIERRKGRRHEPHHAQSPTSSDDDQSRCRSPRSVLVLELHPQNCRSCRVSVCYVDSPRLIHDVEAQGHHIARTRDSDLNEGRRSRVLVFQSGLPAVCRVATRYMTSISPQSCYVPQAEDLAPCGTRSIQSRARSFTTRMTFRVSSLVESRGMIVVGEMRFRTPSS